MSCNEEVIKHIIYICMLSLGNNYVPGEEVQECNDFLTRLWNYTIID